MRLFSLIQSNLKSFRLLLVFIAILCSHSIIEAQATLSVQGIVKKSNGVALEDGEYPITFKMYVVDSTLVKWTENIPNVEVISGIYSVILGQNPLYPLNLPFNKDYELGVSIGSQEMLPRIRLTSAPYALSLRGETNQFPSTGLVLADKIKVAQGTIVNTGAPIVNNVDGTKGYSFDGDNDSGLFSTQNGKVSIYTNGVERYRANTSGTFTNGNDTISGTVGANNINLFNNGSIYYSTPNNGSLSSWRLADIDDQIADAESWQVYNHVGGSAWAWQNGTAAGSPCVCNYSGNSNFIGNVLEPQNNDQVLKKLFSPAGSFSQVKVKFRYYFIDGWDFGSGNQDLAYAGFANQPNGNGFEVAWTGRAQYLNTWGEFNNSDFSNEANFVGQSNAPDSYIDVEMSAKRSGAFWVYIGAHLNESTTDEHYAVSNIEIWVR